MKKFFSIFMATFIVSLNVSTIFADDTKIELPEISKSLDIINSKKNKIQQSNLKKNKDIKIFIDNNQLESIIPVVYQDRIYLPLRTLGETLEFTTDYISENKIVIINYGKIQLPIGQNKAVVDGKIIPIDKENNNIGTVVLDGVTYLPLRFISENLGYKVSYDVSKKIVSIQTGKNKDKQYKQLTQNEARDIYNQILKLNSELKSKTLQSDVNINSILSSGEDKIQFKEISKTDIKLENENNLKLYLKQSVNIESMGEKQTTEQIGFYKDGEFYVKQGEDKVKVKYNLEEINHIISKDEGYSDFIVNASVRELNGNKKEYKFNIDFNKNKELLEELVKGLNLSNEDLDILKNIKVKENTFSIIVDSKNIILEEYEKFSMELEHEGFKIQSNINSKSIIKDMNKTKVEIPNEDLTKYQLVESIEI